jgi:hypothetical protein
MKKILFSALAIIGCANYSLGQSAPSYVPTSGLVGWWPFTGNALDSSGNGNHGKINGGLFISDRNGLLNSALQLPNLIDNATVNNTMPSFNNFGLSVSVWLKFPKQYLYSSLSVVKNGKTYTNGFNIAIDQNNSFYGLNNYKVFFIVGNGTAASFISNQLELGQWANIVGTYDGNSIKVYLNGVLKATQPFNLSLNCPNNDLIFGSWDNLTAPDVTNKHIDDIGIWNRTLTKQEITDLYNASTLGITEKTPIKMFSIYPNPTQSIINVNADNKLIGEVYSILDNTGKVVLSGKINSESTVIGLGNLSGGIYMFSVGENMKNTFKVIKE